MPDLKEKEKPMPLESGSSKAAFSHNVSEERKAGKPEDQAVAIAYSKAREDAEGLWEISGFGKSGKPATIRIRATDFNDAIRKASKAMIGAKEAKLIESEDEKKAAQEKAIAAYKSSRGDGYMDNNAKLDVALAKCAKVDAMCATDPVKLAGMKCAD